MPSSDEVYRSRGFLLVDLRTKDSELACKVWIPPFPNAPDLLRWGDRLFQRESNTWYREVFAHAVVFEEDTPPPVTDGG